jgi:glyoxylase-like metal-dependent hydrolase (beta-lactamase superfamily II)
VLRIADRCFALEHSRGAHGYVVVGEGRTAIIDPGMGSGFTRLMHEIHDSEATTGPITDIVLTHYDIDHAGLAARLSDYLDVPVWLSATDAAILRREVPAPTGLRRFMMQIARVKYPAVVHEFDGAALTEIFPGLTAVPAPGHTPGHVALQWGSVLFSGDAVLVSKEGAFRQFPGFIIGDRAAALATTAALEERVREHDIRWVCGGHSAPARVRRTAPV